MIDQAIEAARLHIHTCAMAVYPEIIDEMTQNGPSTYENRVDKAGRRELQRGHWIKVRLPVFEMMKPEEVRYLGYFHYTISHLDKSDPLACLVDELSKSHFLQALAPSHAEVRFEQGCASPDTPYWHVDTIDHTPYSVFVCYSSKPGWAARYIEDPWLKSEFIKLGYSDHKNVHSVEALEKRAQVCEHGSYYDGSLMVHRSPTKEDVTVTEEDWRLLVRFWKEV